MSPLGEPSMDWEEGWLFREIERMRNEKPKDMPQRKNTTESTIPAWWQKLGKKKP